MMTKSSLFAFVLAAAASAVFAQDKEGQLQEMLSLTKPPAKSATSIYGDCRGQDLVQLAAQADGVVSQYIYNDYYSWSNVQKDGAICVVLLRPIQRILSSKEAELLNAASDQEFPLPKSAYRPLRVDETGKGPAPSMVAPSGGTIDLLEKKSNDRDDRPVLEGDPAIGGSDTAAFQREKNGYQLINLNHPYNGVTLLQTGSSTVGGSSAYQLSPYVYVTNAHNVVQRGGFEYSNVKIFPGYRHPYVTTDVPVVATYYHPNYQSSSNDLQALAYDVAFIKSPTPRYLPKYLPVWGMNLSILRGFELNEPAGITLGDQFTDVWRINAWAHTQTNGCIDSWRHRTLVPTPYGCLGYGVAQTRVQVETFGYPLWVGSTDNRYAHNPYLIGGLLQGSVPNGMVPRGLFHPGNYNHPVVGVLGQVSDGYSGSALVGTLITNPLVDPALQTPKSWLLGVSAAALNGFPLGPYFGASFYGPTNIQMEFWDQHLSWQPNFSLQSLYGTQVVVQGSGPLQIKVNAAGVVNVDVHESITTGGTEGPQQFIGIFSDQNVISRTATVSSGQTRWYKYRMYPRGKMSPLLAEVTVRVEYGRLN